MKNLVFVSMLMFLCCGFSSPHNGAPVVHQNENPLENAKIYQDVPQIIPLQAMGVQWLKVQKQESYYLKNVVNSTLYYRNFLVNGSKKTVLFQAQRFLYPIFQWEKQ